MKKLIISFALLILASVAAFGQKDEVKKFANEAEVPRMTVVEAKKAFDDGSAVFVDSRSPEAYAEEHIKGAVIIKGAAADRFNSLPKGKKIIVYCSWPNENSSARLAFQMNQNGIANVFALKGGFQDWKAAGHPTEKAK